MNDYNESEYNHFVVLIAALVAMGLSFAGGRYYESTKAGESVWAQACAETIIEHCTCDFDRKKDIGI